MIGFGRLLSVLGSVVVGFGLLCLVLSTLVHFGLGVVVFLSVLVCFVGFVPLFFVAL